MNKSIVLNICGVKSLGGLNVVKSALKIFEKTEYKIILLHDNNLTPNINKDSDIQIIETNLKRYFHPYLNIFMKSKDLDTINNAKAIIHFGNFGFKTQNKSFTLIQNLLPLVVTNMKNTLLYFFINKSFKQSDYIIYQLDHVAEKIKKQYKNKLLKIGTVSNSTKPFNNEIGVIGIQSKIKNKNYDFMEEVLKKVATDFPDLKITKFNSELEDNSNSLVDNFSNHNVYFHASYYETVGLPLYEASSAGLFVVAPERDYTKYFDSTNSIKYELGNTESATKSIKEAVNRKKDTLQSVTYKEDWNPILENI
jgi:hypothetical protein